MSLRSVRILSLLFTAITLTPGLAHILELPHKINMPGRDYLVVQQIYRGWAFLGIVILLAIGCTAALAVLSRNKRLAVFALTALIAGQLVFWIFTFPVNRATNNWTTLPMDWPVLRVRWEYSHAAGAIFNLMALIALTISAARSR